MTTGCRRRARNSLSFKKFTDRLDKGLPIFIAYGEEPSVHYQENCRDLHWHVWKSGPGGAMFIYATHTYPAFVHKNHHSLKDMNVYRNKYNQNFVFRTRWAAEQYLLNIGVIRFPGPVAKPDALKKLVDRIITKTKT